MYNRKERWAVYHKSLKTCLHPHPSPTPTIAAMAITEEQIYG